MPDKTTDPTPPRVGIRLDPTINLGHLLTFAGFLIAGFGAFSALDKRVVVLEESRKTQAAVDHAQDTRANLAADQLMGVVLRLERQVERLNDRLDGSQRQRPGGTNEAR